MALLTSCWFIIESFVIPDGILKWFYLSFYIHPFFLVFCRLFLWLQFLINKCILVVIFYPLRIICIVCPFLFRFFRDCVIYLFPFTKYARSPVEVIEEDQDDKYSLVLVQSFNQKQIGVFYCVSNIAPIPSKIKVFEVVEDDDDYVVLNHEEEKMEEQPSISEHISSISLPIDSSCTKDVDLDNDNDHFSSGCSSNNSAEKNSDMNDEHPPSLCIPSSSSMVEREETHDIGGDHHHHQEESDGFYEKYAERMRWFDVLNYDRTCGISAVLNKQIGTPSSVDESNEPHVEYLSVPYWSKETRKRLLRSIESDFEMVYVGQSCLSWEALHYQYTKVMQSFCSGINGVFYGNVVGEFQKFQVLLERFLEDERCEGKRIWNYVRGRFALKSLLQVPQISGFLEEEREDKKGEAVSVKQVLEAIERCVEAFGVFVRIDSNKKPWWKLKSSLWAYPPVEDPRDLHLLHYLTRTLQTKEIWLKDLQGKKRCWFNRVVKPLEESHKKEMLFTMIDMKLVSRVLQMSTISSSQLKWCQQKLENIDFQDGKVFRICTTAPLIFPPS
ncbi:hypothetical protein LWI28_029126 [Acer negundo]|uniref:Uncharacterized protein n=1 Tax=Acer negundo TaxID=4023 RepID=A0AAD5I8R5_ACENE|nr:hypothetical protein LWI28_029126 [Acer negundo]